jgi:hypothetical protein
MKYALTLALVLALSLVAQAAITLGDGGFVKVGSVTCTVTKDTTTPASAGLTAFIVTISSPVGVYAVDGRIDAVAGSYLNQSWYQGATYKATPVEDPNGQWGNLPYQQACDDTNIIVDPLNLVVDRAAAENRTVASTVAGNNGTWLAASLTQTMAFGFQNQPTNPDAPVIDFNSIPLARVVLAGNNVAEFNFHITDSLKADDAFDFNIAVPEPMTLSLLGAGALALIRRRR